MLRLFIVVSEKDLDSVISHTFYNKGGASSFFDLLIDSHRVKFDFEADSIPDVRDATLTDHLLHVLGYYPCVTGAYCLWAAGSFSEAAACWFVNLHHGRFPPLFYLAGTMLATTEGHVPTVRRQPHGALSRTHTGY